MVAMKGDNRLTAADLASEAPRLIPRGFAVFPLAAGRKTPLKGSHSFYEASVDCDVARARWRKHPRANIAVATGIRSDIWALDVDPKHDGTRSLKELIAEHGKLPLTVAAVTPSKGFHLWWRWPESGPEIRDSVGRIGPGLDARGEGGYIIAPPSRLVDGRGYAWVRSPFDHELADAPDWLIKLTMPPKREASPEPKPLSGDIDNYVASAIADELRQLARARQGTRNDQLNRAAFAIAGLSKGGYVPQDWAFAKLEAIAVEIGLPLPEARATIRSAFLAARPREVAS
jgi:hypothetical protein